MTDKIAEMKRLMVEVLLERQGRCFLQILPSASEEGAVLPSEYIERDSCTLALNAGTQLPEISSWGVEVATQFGGRPFTCAVPWSAIIQILDPEQKAAALAWLFPLQDRDQPQADPSSAQAGSENGLKEGEAPELDSKDPRFGHLRVIK